MLGRVYGCMKPLHLMPAGTYPNDKAAARGIVTPQTTNSPFEIKGVGMSIDIQGAMKRFSGAIIRPVLFLAVAGILLAVSVILKMEGMPGPVAMVGSLIYTCVNSGVVGNLGLLFCIGLTCALANKKKGDAAVIAASTFLVFLYADNAWLTSNNMLADASGGLYGTGQGMVLGVQVVDMGVFIGIILGCLNGWLFNRFCDVKFPEVVSTYDGTRWVFFLAITVAGVLGVLMCYVWPTVNGWINSLQTFIYDSNYIGQFVYGFLNKLLIPTGMHHLLWMPFMYSAVGGTAQIAGESVSGAYNIFMAELGNTASITAMDPSIRFCELGFGKWFGTIGTVLAFISVAPKQHRAKVRGMLVPAALVAILAGITEPFEFMYLWASPILFVVNAALDGLFQCILYAAGWRALLTGFIETVPGLIALPADLSHWFVVIPVGAVAVAVWFVVFRTLILKLNLITPGREDEFELPESAEETAAPTSAVAPENVKTIIEGLGGSDNIVKVMNCFTRLRVDVKDISLVDEDVINTVKNSGIVHGGPNNIQIVIGMKVGEVCEAVNKALGRETE